MKAQILLAGLICVFSSCNNEKEPPEPVRNGLIIPLTTTTVEQEGNGESAQIAEDAMLPLVNLGENYNILAVYNGNLDLEQSDEQILLAVPLDDKEVPISLMIATTQASQNAYTIAWQTDLSTRTLTDINLHLDDLNGNNRDDIVIAGFDNIGNHVTEVFAAPTNGQIPDFSRVFSLRIKGNIDIITVKRSVGYYSGISDGAPYPIVVQQHDPSSENELDLIETRWEWNSRAFAYLETESKLVKAKTILEDRISKLYASDVADYEDYLRGAWYRESGESAYEDMLHFNPAAREIMFYDGEVLEIFVWGPSHRTTAKRLYFKITNWVVPSMNDTVYISVDSWDSIQLARSSREWNSSYRRLNSSLHNTLMNQISLTPLLSNQSISGIWDGFEDDKIVFDLPRIEWIKDGVSRVGTASFFNLRDIMVLQIQFLDEDGALEETVNWAVEYSEEIKNNRIIRSIALSLAELDADGIENIAMDLVRFEQIEEFSPVN